MTILVTGATGCVGRYLIDALLAQTGDELLLLLRNPAALPAHLHSHPRIRFRLHDMARDVPPLDDLPPIRAAILVATAWGGPDAVQVIRDANLAIADLLIATGCPRILYFSTASVLDRDGALLEVARDQGTDYIRGKFALTEAMESRATQTGIIGLFPTLVIGGSADGSVPMSHFARLLHQIRPWAWLARFLDASAKLHIIHAADIARICAHLAVQPALPTPPTPQRLVLGNPASTLDALVRAYLAHTGHRRRALIRLRPGLAEALIWLFRIRLSPWDRHCMRHPDQSYSSALNPADFGLPVQMPGLTVGLVQIGLRGRRNGG